MTDEAQTLESVPVAAEAEPPAPDTAGEITPQPAEPQPEPGEEAEADDARSKRPSGTQRLKRRNQALQSENADLLRRLADLKRVRDGDAAPRAADFNGDTVAFERARQSYDTRQAVREELRRREESERAGRDHAARREAEIAYRERVDDVRERIADFDGALKSMQGVFVNDAVIDEIQASDKGPLLAYHLARNPERLRELNGLTGRELAREIGRLEGSVRMPAGNKQTNAGKPPSSLKGGAAPAASLSGKSPEEYRKLREGGIT